MINPSRFTLIRALCVITRKFCCALVMIGASAFCWDSFVAVKAKSPSYALSLPASGSLTANPSPIQVCDGSGLGVTTLSWTSTGTSAVEVHLDEPTGMLLAATGPSGAVTTGKWVGNATQFFLQDVSGGLPLSPENTLATITVYLTGCSSPGGQWTTSGNNINNTNTGNVGIGTSVPGFKLDVQGGEINSAGGLCIAGDCKSAWSQVGGAGSSQWTNAGSNIVFTAGNVGIGTPSPEARLDIGGGNLRVQSGTLDLNNQVRDDSINLWGGFYTLGIRPWTFYAKTSQKFRFESALSNSALSAYELGSTAGATFLAVKNDGNVGIGTATPGSTLQVNGGAAIGYPGSTTVGPNSLSVAGNITIGTSAAAGKLLIKGAGTGFTTGIGMYADAGAPDNGYVWMDFTTPNVFTMQGGNSLSFGGTPIVLQNKGGNVGIGTTAPAFRLDVAGMVRSSSGGFVFPDGTVQTTAGGGSITAVNAGSGLTGGGTSGSLTLNVGAGTGVTVAADTVSVNYGSTAGTAVQGNTSITILAGLGLSGGGPLTLGAGGSLTLTNSDRGSSQSIFKNVANAAGTPQFAAGFNNDSIRFEGGGGTTVSFDPATKKVVISSSTSGSSSTAANVSAGQFGQNTGGGNYTFPNDVTVNGNIAAKYQDMAEWVESSQELPPGAVVVLDSSRSNQVIASTQSYDSRVAGVISLRPGLTLGEPGEGRVLVATTGRVKVKVDATKGPVQIGDLLVTSNREGFAMKSLPVEIGGVHIHRPGTLIGKALEPLASGTGEILVLLSLQ